MKQAAKRRVGLLLLQALRVHADGGQGFVHRPGQAEVAHRVTLLHGSGQVPRSAPLTPAGKKPPAAPGRSVT